MSWSRESFAGLVPGGRINPAEAEGGRRSEQMVGMNDLEKVIKYSYTISRPFKSSVSVPNAADNLAIMVSYIMQKSCGRPPIDENL